MKAQETQLWKECGFRAKIRHEYKRRLPIFNPIAYLSVSIIFTLLFYIDAHTLTEQGFTYTIPQSYPTHESIIPGTKGTTLYIFQNQDNLKPEIYFEGIRFIPHKSDNNLITHLELSKRRLNGHSLLVHADANITHGEMCHIETLIRQAGITNITIGIQETTKKD